MVLLRKHDEAIERLDSLAPEVRIEIIVKLLAFDKTRLNFQPILLNKPAYMEEAFIKLIKANNYDTLQMLNELVAKNQVYKFNFITANVYILDNIDDADQIQGLPKFIVDNNLLPELFLLLESGKLGKENYIKTLDYYQYGALNSYNTKKVKSMQDSELIARIKSAISEDNQVAFDKLFTLIKVNDEYIKNYYKDIKRDYTKSIASGTYNISKELLPYLANDKDFILGNFLKLSRAKMIFCFTKYYPIWQR